MATRHWRAAPAGDGGDMTTFPGARETMPAARSGPARVLFLHPSDELYGSDLVLLNLLRGLDRSRFTPLVVLANDLPYQGALSRELEASGIEVRHLPIAVARRKYLSPTGLLGFRRTLRRSTRMITDLLASERIDLVHTNTLAVWTGALAARRAHRPHIWHVHEQLDRPALLRRYLARFVPSHSTRVIGVAQAALDRVLLSPQAKAKGFVLDNGMEPEPWMEATGRERVRAELGCAPDDMLFGMVARVSWFKGTDVGVHAMARLLMRHASARCFIAGGPVPGQTEVLDQVQRLIATSPAPERFHVLGLRRDVPDLMAAMDVLLAPSRGGEGASMTIIQAMFSGKPVIATDVGGNRELVVDGTTGMLAPSEDVDRLADQMAALASDPARRGAMGQAARERALARYTLARQVARFNQVLEAMYQEYRAAVRS
jgi:glycosyltransferase involved in cell wall biosynthesis